MRTRKGVEAMNRQHDASNRFVDLLFHRKVAAPPPNKRIQERWGKFSVQLSREIQTLRQNVNKRESTICTGEQKLTTLEVQHPVQWCLWPAKFDKPRISIFFVLPTVEAINRPLGQSGLLNLGTVCSAEGVPSWVLPWSQVTGPISLFHFALGARISREHQRLVSTQSFSVTRWSDITAPLVSSRLYVAHTPSSRFH